MRRGEAKLAGRSRVWAGPRQARAVRTGTGTETDATAASVRCPTLLRLGPSRPARREARGPLLRAWRACEWRPIPRAASGSDGGCGQSTPPEGAGPWVAGPGRERAVLGVGVNARTRT